MIERLGNVLYWLACGSATLWASDSAVIYLAQSGTRDGWMILPIAGIGAFLIWIAGRLLLYVLAGR